MQTQPGPARIRVAALTQGRNVPSARLRVRQLIPPLSARGVDLRESWAPLGAYPSGPRWMRPAWLAASLASRAPQVLRSRAHDVVLLQRELISTLSTFERWTGRPRVLDVDDAIHLHRGGRTARRLAGLCQMVVCGNAHLAGVFKEWNPNVAVLPTAVDPDHYRPLDPSEEGQREPAICWVGTHGNFQYLRLVQDSLARVLRQRPGSSLVVVADRPPDLPAIPPARLRFVRWTPQAERDALRAAAVGIMPLLDSPWARGKCSYKMLASMASGLPVVVSPVGMNREILAQGRIGVGATDGGEWEEAILRLLDDEAEARRLGAAGRALVMERYSVDRVADGLAACLARVA